MPVYEEKLICPFAVRFTQEHIRTTFRDSRDVEATVPQIEAQPADGSNYDIILRAPFPNIEIIRWSGRHDDEDSHWFSFDNRRLYVLQRAAANHWPLRVAAVVEVLYSADRGSWWRKFDTMTCGQCVSVRHSSLGDPIRKWDWHQAVEQGISGNVAVAQLFAQKAALKAVGADAVKLSIDDLQDAPDNEILQAVKTVVVCNDTFHNKNSTWEGSTSGNEALPACCTTPSTGISDDDSPHDMSPPSSQQIILATLTKNLKGSWEGPEGETYRFRPRDEHTWTCIHNSGSGCKRFTVTYDQESSLMWWGSHFFNPSEVCADPEQIRWQYGDMKKHKTYFTWHKVHEAPSNVKVVNYHPTAGKKAWDQQVKTRQHADDARGDACSSWSNFKGRPHLAPRKWAAKGKTWEPTLRVRI